ncbi:MAG: DUF4271 domain-containing protein [Bacteroidetes bacterium]|nr:MAG: DUF4271 domain-containing protein [Bacteroidota bacterium]
MNISCSNNRQDTLPHRNTVVQDTVRIKSDSPSVIKILSSKSLSSEKSSTAPDSNFQALIDTTSVCQRNNIADITFYDSNNFITKIDTSLIDRFPFLFIERTRKTENEARAALMKQLKPGKDLPSQPLHNDWMLGIILIAAFLYSLIRTTSKSMLQDISRFFLFRGINDPSSRDIGGLFHWQSTILNLISFLIIALFTYCAASCYNLIPFGFSGIIFWLISLGIIISAVTLRHLLCILTGNVSGENEVFREYLLGIYQSYRFSALFLFVLVILNSYTTVLPAGIYFISGSIVFGIMYLIRIIRLMIIFLNRNISIFYLILYLCALEFLPVVISVKYFSGLV